MLKLKYCPFLSGILFISLFLSTSLADAQPIMRKKTNLDADWKFKLGHAADASKDFNYSIAVIFSKSGKAEHTPIDSRFDDQEWRTINLPHDWAVELPFENSSNDDVMAHGYRPVGGRYPQNSIGWYRKQFTIAKADSGRRYTLQFDGIFRNSKVWLNGFYLGTNESGYLGFTFDVTDYVNYSNPNTLVVRVDATQYEGWFYEGAGIYRHVWLNEFDDTHVIENGIFAYSNIGKNDATITVETTVATRSLQPGKYQVHTYIADRTGKQLVKSDAQTVALQCNEQRMVKQQLTIKNPRLWSLADPYLYKIVSVVSLDNKIIDRQQIRYGIRSITIDAVKGVVLNNTPIKIQGVNCHQDHAGLGSALPDYIQYYRVGLLKELGVNAYRTSHNAPTPELLDACDSLGMLVMDENRLLNSSPEYIDQFKRLILRDRSRTSVFMWSIGNEEAYIQKNSFGKRLATTLLTYQQQLDPTRTATYAADLGNFYNGINEVIPVRGFNYREKYVIPYHHDHPQQPILGTEMGSTVTTRGIYATDSIKGYVPDQDITAPWWASTAEAWWPIAADNTWFAGGFVWTGFDYRGEPTPYKWPNVNSHFGIMDVCGFPKNIYYYYKSWWTTEDVLHISPHWNWTGKEGQPIDVWVNSNANSIELFLNGKSLGQKAMPANKHLQWSVPYKPGKLEAVALKDGRKIKYAVETTGAPYHVVLTSDKKVLMADGADATVINITVVDKQGRQVPDASNIIHFDIKGNGKIIGMGNGDPSCHESDQYSKVSDFRSLFGGRAQIIVQSGGEAGTITVEAKSDNLLPAVTIINVLKND